MNNQSQIALNELLLCLAKIERARPELKKDMGLVYAKAKRQADRGASAKQLREVIRQIESAPMFADIF